VDQNQIKDTRILKVPMTQPYLKASLAVSELATM